MVFPRMIAGGFTGTPDDGYGHVNLQLDYSVPPCTEGYKPPQPVAAAQRPLRRPDLPGPVHGRPAVRPARDAVLARRAARHRPARPTAAAYDPDVRHHRRRGRRERQPGAPRRPGQPVGPRRRRVEVAAGRTGGDRSVSRVALQRRALRRGDGGRGAARRRRRRACCATTRRRPRCRSRAWSSSTRRPGRRAGAVRRHPRLRLATRPRRSSTSATTTPQASIDAVMAGATGEFRDQYATVDRGRHQDPARTTSRS